VTRHHCDCGFYARTLATLRAHARKCRHAYAKLRAVEDRARLDRIERAKKTNDAAREDAWRQALEQP
jgi:hypothetical protein